MISVGAGEDVVMVGDAGGTNDAVLSAKDEGDAITEHDNRSIDINNKRWAMVKAVSVTLLFSNDGPSRIFFGTGTS